MPYLIDGHNLIPHLPGLSLSDPDDELKLIQKLQGFARRRTTRIEVFFDRAAPTQSRRWSVGRVTAVFVREGSTADAAIRKRLESLKKKAKNWTVVSADHEVLRSARQVQARMLSSADFAWLLAEQGASKKTETAEKTTPELTKSDLDYWLEQFSGKE